MVFVTGRHKGELALERSQLRRRKTPNERLAVVTNALFVDK
jgi:hypothetical protein